MAANTVVTIARQYGSGGREIGLRLAEKMGVKCYDKELLDRAARTAEYVRNCSNIMMKNLQTVFFIHWSWIPIPLAIPQRLLQTCLLITKFFWLSLTLSKKSQARNPVLW